MTSIELNEYTEKLSELQWTLDRIVNSLNIDTVTLNVTGKVKYKFINQVREYLTQRDITVITKYDDKVKEIESSGVNALNRIYG